MTRQGRRIPKADMPLTPGPITPMDIGNAFDKASVPRPAPTEINRLSKIFTHYKEHFLDAEHQRHLNAMATSAGAAIQTLAETLPPLLEYQSELARAGDPFAKWQAEAIGKMLAAVTSADVPRIEAQSNVPSVIRDWRWVVEVIAQVIAPAFPPDTGMAKGGPASRFLAAILPSVTGEAPTASAIATQISKLSTREK